MYKSSSTYKSYEKDRKNDIAVKRKERNYIRLLKGNSG